MAEYKDIPTRMIQGKLVILGESAVGKTSLRRRYMGKGFMSSHLTTIGADFASKELKMEGDIAQNFLFQIWDIAGQDSFKLVRARFLQKADAALFVFDLSREETFQHLDKWLIELLTFNKGRIVPILFIGNKIDLNNPKKKDEEKFTTTINQISKKFPIKPLGILYTSAKTGVNVDNAFQILVKEIYKVRKHSLKE